MEYGSQAHLEDLSNLMIIFITYTRHATSLLSTQSSIAGGQTEGLANSSRTL